MSDDAEKTQWKDIGGATVMPPQLVQGRALLLRLRGILQTLIDKDQKEIALLREQQHRNKHGGGA